MVPSVFKGIKVSTEGVESDIAGRADLVTDVAGTEILLPSGSFGQANSYINSRLAETVQNVLSLTGRVNRCIEFFSGAGNRWEEYCRFDP
jgi:tRNA/tmRNA/rRNA uracil-C5-methylase (TrmA/RlmC/RlmD family)